MCVFSSLFRIKKIDHTYSKDVKKQISNTKKQGEKALIRNSAMMTFQNTKGENKFNFAEDAWLADYPQNLVNYTTGQRQTQQTVAMSSEAGEQDIGRVYKFKQYGPDGLTSVNQDGGPPSSYWREHNKLHNIPAHLLKTPKM